jgi:recombination protein RecA
MRMDIRRIAAIKDGQDVIGNRTKVKVVKSKVAPPFKEVEFDILYNHGISWEGDLIDLATKHNIVKKSGAWFTYGEDRFQGREQFRQKLVEMPEIAKSLEKDVKQALGMEEENGSEEEKQSAEQSSSNSKSSNAKKKS